MEFITYVRVFIIINNTVYKERVDNYCSFFLVFGDLLSVLHQAVSDEP